MTVPIGLQLYTLREAIAEDFEGTIRKVAKMGYIGIEPWGGVMTEVAEKRKLYDELGLTAASVHYGMPVGDNKNEIIENTLALGAKTIALPYIDPNYFTSMDGVKQVAEMLNEGHEAAKGHGISIHYHNHDFEMQAIDGRPALVHLTELVDPAVGFELDTYWIQVGGGDPADFVTKMGTRSPLLHIKDGPADNRQSDMTALGTGAIDIPAIIAAGGDNTEWVFVELDRCATDMMTAVQESYTYLTSNGLAKGNV